MTCSICTYPGGSDGQGVNHVTCSICTYPGGSDGQGVNHVTCSICNSVLILVVLMVKV